MPAAPLLPPVPLDLLPQLLRRRGVVASLKRVQQAVAAGALPGRREGGRWMIDEADLGEVERYFRDNPPGTARGGAAARATAGRR
jgi:hypothetical protein